MQLSARAISLLQRRRLFALKFANAGGAFPVDNVTSCIELRESDILQR